MIRFENGHELTFACASGALAFDGRGWWFEQPWRWLGIIDPKAFTVVAKTVTLNPIKGNYVWWHPWTCIRRVRSGGRIGLTNAVGLTNDGIRTWVRRDLPMAQRLGYTMAASIKVDSVTDAEIIAGILETQEVPYIEVNVSCPNTADPRGTDLPAILRRLWLMGHPLVLKLAVDQVRKEFIQAVDGYCDAYHAINSVPWDNVFPGVTSPIEKYPHGQKGGVSGQHTIDEAIRCVELVQKFTDKPVIGGSGIFCLDDVYRYERAGAKAFSIGTCFPLRPWRPNRIVKDYFKAKPKLVVDHLSP